MEAILNNGLLIGSILLGVSIFLSKSSAKFGMPILVLFMIIGMAVGDEGIGIIHYENYELTHSLSLVAICVIIFSGGLSTKWENVQPILARGICLSTLGILLTTGLLSAFAYFVFNVPLIESLLLGSILSSTDAAAVFSVLRDKNAKIKKDLRTLIEFESGSNDPMAYFLVSLLLGIYQQSEISYEAISIQFITNPLIGLTVGYLVSRLFQFINDNYELDHLGLYPVLTFSFLFFNYSITNKLGGNGFLAVYVFGIFLGNKKILHKIPLIAFFDGISWLAQIGLFILLGILVFPSRLAEVFTIGTFTTIFLLFIARPVVVFLCLIKSKFSMQEKVFISWAGLKGATPIVFASFAATVPQNSTLIMFDIVFFTVLISALVQGSTLKVMAKKFGLMYESIHDPEFPINEDILNKTKGGIKQYRLSTEDYAIGKRIVDINLPHGARILFIYRASQFIIPDGATVFEVRDKILLATNNKEDIEAGIDCIRFEDKRLTS